MTLKDLVVPTCALSMKFAGKLPFELPAATNTNGLVTRTCVYSLPALINHLHDVIANDNDNILYLTFLFDCFQEALLVAALPEVPARARAKQARMAVR